MYYKKDVKNGDQLWLVLEVNNFLKNKSFLQVSIPMLNMSSVNEMKVVVFP